MTTQRRLLASFAGKKLRARPRAARPFRPRRIHTAEELRLLEAMTKAEGPGREAWVEKFAELILDQAYAIGDL
jgi:hypothetical protein